MSAQRARSSVAAERRSAHPNIPGVPWWGAVLIAVGTTAAGFAFDAGSGSTELTNVFAAMYIIGCVAAVLAVRQAGIFTAVVQPPLILFIAVPGAYYLFHHAEIKGAKDILINCGYPLIERFLLMFATSVVVLLIGMARWYFGASARAGKATTTAKQDVPATGMVSGVRAKLSGLLGGGAAAAEVATDGAEPPLKHAIARPATAEKPTRTRRPAKRTTATRSRHARPPADDLSDLDAPPEPRRRRPSQARDFDRDSGPGAPDETAPPPRRRPRVPRDPDERTPPPRQYRPREEPDPYGRPAPRRSRYEPRETYEPPERREPPPERRDDRYDAPPPRRRPTAKNGPNGTHHPVSKVRYRDTEAQDGDNQAEYRRRPRHRADSDRWRYEP